MPIVMCGGMSLCTSVYECHCKVRLNLYDTTLSTVSRQVTGTPDIKHPHERRDRRVESTRLLLYKRCSQAGKIEGLTPTPSNTCRSGGSSACVQEP